MYSRILKFIEEELGLYMKEYIEYLERNFIQYIEEIYRDGFRPAALSEQYWSDILNIDIDNALLCYYFNIDVGSGDANDKIISELDEYFDTDKYLDFFREDINCIDDILDNNNLVEWIKTNIKTIDVNKLIEELVIQDTIE
jgi:hypothetical protein